MQKMDDKIANSLFDLQLDLENSLRLLTKKYNELSKNFADKKDDKTKALDIGERRTSTSDCKPYKKIKLSSEKTQKSSLAGRAKSKRNQSAKSQESGLPDKSDVPKIQKNDSSNRFWSFFDCYCADLNMDDINVLERWIESHDKDSEYQNVPEIGVHYSSKWMDEEIIEEMKEGSKSMENPKGTDCTSLENNLKFEFAKKIQDKIIASSNLNHPPLVEKLISALVQENIITSNDIMTESIPDDDCVGRKAKAAQPVTDSTLENRLRNQLVELGVLEAKSSREVDDELVQEMRRLQSLLIPISELNLQKKKALLSRAKAEVAKQEAQKRIYEADAKVMESYRTMSAARLKGKKLSKKEMSQIRCMLEERDTLIKNKRIESEM